MYAYDQHLRLAAVREAIRAIPGGSGAAALDFGCGVGDFCGLLASHFDQVIGYDISPEVLALAQRRHAASKIRFESRMDTALAGHYDLILSVTVLQHVTDDAALQALLRQLADRLTPGGRFVVLETFSPRQGTQTSNGYLTLRCVDALITAFGAVGLHLQARRGFYHPTESPTRAFATYRRSPSVRGLARLAAWRIPIADTLLSRIAACAADADTGFLADTDSATQLLTFGRPAQ
ncbi:MAG: class I SAM-dependent methyltransferase [Pseudomonadota bacterium]|nr:class I SAM-dependent methyltransferase [Pseudomonadota bacterium]